MRADPRADDLPAAREHGAAPGDVKILDAPPPGEREVIARLLAGDEAAFDALVAAHHGAMQRVARIFLGKPDVAEEIVQETWLIVLRGLAAFEGRSSLKTWIFRILANRARSRASREIRVVPFAELASTEGDGGIDAELERRFAADGHWQAPPADWAVHSPEGLMLRQEAMRHLGEALEQLPPAQRSVVTLRDVDGWSAAEVCSALQISEGNQRVLLHRARSRLRRALEDALGPR